MTVAIPSVEAWTVPERDNLRFVEKIESGSYHGMGSHALAGSIVVGRAGIGADASFDIRKRSSRKELRCQSSNPMYCAGWGIRCFGRRGCPRRGRAYGCGPPGGLQPVRARFPRRHPFLRICEGGAGRPVQSGCVTRGHKRAGMHRNVVDGRGAMGQVGATFATNGWRWKKPARAALRPWHCATRATSVRSGAYPLMVATGRG